MSVFLCPNRGLDIKTQTSYQSYFSKYIQYSFNTVPQCWWSTIVYLLSILLLLYALIKDQLSLTIELRKTPYHSPPNSRNIELIDMQRGMKFKLIPDRIQLLLQIRTTYSLLVRRLLHRKFRTISLLGCVEG